MTKATTTVRIDVKLLEKSKLWGFNVSKILNSALASACAEKDADIDKSIAEFERILERCNSNSDAGVWAEKQHSKLLKLKLMIDQQS